MASSDISFIRWLEQNNMGDYTANLRDLGMTSISNLLSLTHSQLLEVGRQLGLPAMRQVLFAESIINNDLYTHKTSILNDNSLLSVDIGISLAYKLLNLLKKLSVMGPRDNWDNVTEEIYGLIDANIKNIRLLISSIEETLKIDKNNYIAWDLNGLINAKRGFLADARVAFQRSLVIFPNYLNARFNHARLLHYELTEYQTAKSEYECILRVKPNFSRAYNSYAKLMEKLGDLEMAEKYFRSAIQLRPKSISYRHYLANILSSQNRHFEVQQIYQESVEQHTKSATLRFHHALALVKCKYFHESEMEFKNAIKLNSNNAQIYHEYAKFCERHREPRDYKKATDLYFKACQTDPINFLHGAVDAANLMRRLDTKQSLNSSYKLFEKLVIEAPHLNGAFLGFAKLLVRQKKYNQAVKILNNGLKHHPSDKLLLEYLSSVNSNNARPSIIYSNPNPNPNPNDKSSLPMTEDINTPPLPYKDTEGRISNLINKNAQLLDHKQSLLKHHRQSIQNKITLNENEIFHSSKNKKSKKSSQNIQSNSKKANKNNSRSNNPSSNNSQARRTSNWKTSEQFNPKSRSIVEKRKSQQFQSALPINQKPELKQKRASISNNVHMNHNVNVPEKETCLVM